jgi:ABC-type glycerol-3-phosphate transport system permease component
VAVAVQQAVQTHAAASPSLDTSGLQDLLNKLAALLSPYVVVIAAALATSVQSFLNKLPWLQHEVAKVQDLRRKLLAVALPVVGTLLAGLATGQNTLHLAPWIFLVGQVLYATVQAIKASGASAFSGVTLASDAPSEG